jgi:hypothetical protein
MVGPRLAELELFEPEKATMASLPTKGRVVLKTTVGDIEVRITYELLRALLTLLLVLR